jgi:hypothetical protein
MLPALVWFGLMWVHYGSPGFPHTRTAESALADRGGFRTREGSADGTGGAALAEHVLPVHRGGPAVFAKDAFCGLSLSLLLSVSTIAALAAGLTSAGRGPAALGALRRLVLVYLAAYAVVGYVFFLDFPDYPHYIAMLIAPLPAVAAARLLRGRVLRAAAAGVVGLVFVAGVGYWAKNTWGHTPEGSVARNARLLWPTYGTPIERIARRTDSTTATLAQVVAEYQRAYDALRPGEHILYADHEPGALIPSLLDREYLGEVTFLDDRANRPVVRARTQAQLRAELARSGFRFVVRPGREHPEAVGSLLFDLLARYRGPEQAVVPVDGLLAGG